MEQRGSFPEVPEDIARIIIELVAECDKNTALNLLCVSRRVQGWVVPIVYRDVILRSLEHACLFATLVAADRQRRSLFQRTAKSLTFTSDSIWQMGRKKPDEKNLVGHIFSACCNVHTLVLLVDTVFANDWGLFEGQFHYLRPARLSCPVAWISSISLELALPSLTHLDLIFDAWAQPDYVSDWDFRILGSFQSLQFLSLHTLLGDRMGSSALRTAQQINDALQSLLQACPPSLRALIVQKNAWSLTGAQDEARNMLGDHRVIFDNEILRRMDPWPSFNYKLLWQTWGCLETGFRWLKEGEKNCYQVADQIVAERQKQNR